MPKAASNPPAIISLLCHNVLYDACALMNTILLDPVIVGGGWGGGERSLLMIHKV